MGTFRLSPALKAKGEQAEQDFRAWLDWSRVAYMYVEQSPLYVPESLRGRIKRPDFLVGVPRVGLMAFDVKAKQVNDGMLIFDHAEVEKLALFASMFHLTLHFVCMVGSDDSAQRWVPLNELAQAPAEWRRRQRVVRYPFERAVTIPADLPFLQALCRICSLPDASQAPSGR